MKKENGATLINTVLVILVIILIVMVFTLLYSQGKTSKKSNTKFNAYGQEVENIRKDETTTMSLKSSIAKKLIEKVDFESGILDELIGFKKIDFINENSEDYVYNDTILRMAMSKSFDELVKIDSQTGNQIHELEQKKLERSIENIFGDKIKYTNAMFKGIISSTFENGNIFNTEISYNRAQKKYSMILRQEGGNGFKYIKQVPFKINQVDESTIELEQKIGFIVPIQKDGSWTNKAYKDYISGELKNLQTLIDEKETIEDLENKMEKEELNIVKYTFKLDKSMNQYYLTNFEYKN